MKKVLMCIICLLLILTVSACSTIDLQPNDISSQLSSEKAVTLIRALTGSDNISHIESLSLIKKNSSIETKITDSKDWVFLEKYLYSNIVSAVQKNDLIESNNTYLIKIGVSEQEIYLLNDGSIIKPEMCGDSAVSMEDRCFEIFKAEEQYMLNEERVVELLGKYNKDELNLEVTSKEQETSSTGPTICPPKPFDYSDQEKVNETVTIKNQLPEVKYLTNDNNTQYKDIVNLKNGGYAVAGIKSTYDYILSLIRIYDENAQLQNEYLFGAGNGFEKIATCNDGGFIAASYCPPCITKVNSNFETEWFMPYENVEFGGAVQDIEEISPEVIAVLFVSLNSPDFSRRLKLSFLDKDGTLIETVDLMKNVDPQDADLIADGNGGFYLLTACDNELTEKYPLVAEEYDNSKATEAIIMHFSAERELVWAKILGGGGDDWIEESTIDNDGNIYLAVGTDWYGADSFWEMGVERSMPYRRMLVKLDKNGDLVYKVPLSAKGMAVDHIFGIHIKDGKAYVVGMTDYFDGYQIKYPCEQILPEEKQRGERVFCVFNACIDSDGNELDRKIFRCDINNEPCDSVLLPNGSLVIAGSVSAVENPFNLKFPLGIDSASALFIYK